MESGRVMDRLLCGDVGYGKTEVALRAAFKAVMNGKQVAITRAHNSTGLPAFQYYEERFSDFGVRCEMLSRFRSASEQETILRKLREKELDAVVGTHRVLSKDVKFADLGLLVVDEEQALRRGA